MSQVCQFCEAGVPKKPAPVRIRIKDEDGFVILSGASAERLFEIPKDAPLIAIRTGPGPSDFFIKEAE